MLHTPTHMHVSQSPSSLALSMQRGRSAAADMGSLFGNAAHLFSQWPEDLPSFFCMSSVFDACTSRPVMAAMRKQTTPGNSTSAALILH